MGFQELSNYIISGAALVSAIFVFIDKIILPVTKYGKRKREEEISRQDQKTASLVKAATEESIAPVKQKLEQVDQKIKDITSLNIEQSRRIDQLDRKIDTNEIDRIRHELLSFAHHCRNGAIPSQEEFNHKFELHKKYESLLSNLGMTNGQIDLEYKFVEEYYLNLCRENQIK